jgi:hypothetical protein
LPGDAAVKYATLVPETDDLRVRLKKGLKDRWDALIAEKKTTHQAALNELVEWFVGVQDGLLQSMLLGQIKRDDRRVLELLLRDLYGQAGLPWPVVDQTVTIPPTTETEPSGKGSTRTTKSSRLVARHSSPRAGASRS